MNTHDQLRLNSIKNSLARHQPIAPDDLLWLINQLENTDLALEEMAQKHSRLKEAIIRAQVYRDDNRK